MASILNGIETLPKISDNRQTNGR